MLNNVIYKHIHRDFHMSIYFVVSFFLSVRISVSLIDRILLGEGLFSALFFHLPTRRLQCSKPIVTLNFLRIATGHIMAEWVKLNVGPAECGPELACTVLHSPLAPV